jgi:hypothetical protein
VLCPKCKSEQPDTSKFCSQCAEPLTQDGKKAGSSKTWALVALLALILGLVLIGFIGSRNSSKVDPNEAFLREMAKNPPVKVPQPHFVPITNGAATVAASSYSWYTFVAPTGASSIAVNGHFSAAGGQGNDIDCYILDEDGFVNFKNGHPTGAYYNSGKVTQAKIGVANLAPGTYYLILDNRFSLITPKAVQIDATLSYAQ